MTNLVTNKDTPWECLQHPGKNIFYWVHSKCACSYYKKIFQIMSWKPCTTHDINWGKDLVFSHIRNPLEKHRTGLIEYFYFNRCQHILETNWDNNDFWLMLSRAPWLDVHSMSVWAHFEEKTNFINWIPLDTNHVSHLDATLDLIEFTGERRDFYSIKKQNVSEGFKKQCVTRLMSIEPDPLIIKYLEHDQIIYDGVAREAGFEPINYQKRLQKLLADGHERKVAESMLDHQVATGDYLNWQD